VVLTVITDPGTILKGNVVDEQGVGIVGAQVTVDNSSLTATTTTGGQFTINGLSTIISPYTIHASTTINSVSYTGTKAAVTAVVGGTTQAGNITLLNLNDTSAIKATLGLQGSAFRVARSGK